MTPVDIFERGVEERIVRNTRIAGRAELYFAMRRKALEQTHQQAMDEFAQELGAQYTDVPTLARAYFGRWQARYDESIAAFNRRLEELRRDRNMDSLRRQQALQTLRPPMYPAWDEDRERGFLNTYGDPRENVADWNHQLDWLSEPEVDTQNGANNIVYRRTPWELFVPELLAHPEMDRSVAACVSIGPGMKIVDPNGRITATREAFAPPVGDGGLDKEMYAAMMKAALSVCPHCKEFFPKGLRQHEPACAREHGVDALPEASDAATD